MLLSTSRTSDAVDAIVAATALGGRAAVVGTSAPEDRQGLFGEPVSRRHPGLLVV